MGAQRVTDKGDGKKYFTVIPNVVYTLRLSPHEMALYNILKRTAGDDGTCWKSTSTLAKETGMSAGSVTNAKFKLCQPRVELNGMALIIVTEERNEKGGKPKHLITITDVWPFNGPSSNSELDIKEQVHPVKLQVHPVNLASSISEIKNIPSEENQHEEDKEEESDLSQMVKDSLRCAPPFTGLAFSDALADYEQHRAEKKSRLTPTARRNLYKKLERMGETRAVAALEYSVVQGYTGVFEENENGKNRSESSTERNARNLRENAAYIRKLSNGGSETDREDPIGLLASGF
jgi:hypothetical protein